MGIGRLSLGGSIFRYWGTHTKKDRYRGQKGFVTTAGKKRNFTRR